MAFLNNKNVIVKGIAAAVPSNSVEIRNIYRPEWGNVEDFISATNVERIRISPKNQTTSDLCVSAANQLIDSLGWTRDSIEALVFITQTPDFYFIPATACHCQYRLGLSNKCIAFDITLGCSGWIYGISVLASLLNSGSIKRAILLVGDTCSKNANPNDSGSAPLFGDAGTATALEYNPDCDSQNNGIKSVLFTDGSGYDAIICKEGGYRYPITADSFIGFYNRDGVKRPPFCTEMDGISVFTFAISQAPKSIKELIDHFKIDKSQIDILALHQANFMINQKIIKKVKLDKARLPQSMRDFGNTAGSSIPLSLVTEEAESLRSKKEGILACGFGVGLSWGAVYFESDHIVVPELIEI